MVSLFRKRGGLRDWPEWETTDICAHLHTGAWLLNKIGCLTDQLWLVNQNVPQTTPLQLLFYSKWGQKFEICIHLLFPKTLNYWLRPWTHFEPAEGGCLCIESHSFRPWRHLLLNFNRMQVEGTSTLASLVNFWLYLYAADGWHLRVMDLTASARMSGLGWWWLPTSAQQWLNVTAIGVCACVYCFCWWYVHILTYIAQRFSLDRCGYSGTHIQRQKEGKQGNL